MARQERLLSHQMSAALSARQNGRRKFNVNGTAEFVELSSSRVPRSLHSARVDAGTAIVQSILALPGRFPVYNMTVNECPEFLANGTITHNCTWTPGDKSPDRLDAYVWLFWGLILEGQVPLGLVLTGAGAPLDEPTKQAMAAKVVEDAIREQGVYWP